MTLYNICWDFAGCALYFLIWEEKRQLYPKGHESSLQSLGVSGKQRRQIAIAWSSITSVLHIKAIVNSSSHLLLQLQSVTNDVSRKPRLKKKVKTLEHMHHTYSTYIYIYIHLSFCAKAHNVYVKFKLVGSIREHWKSRHWLDLSPALLLQGLYESDSGVGLSEVHIPEFLRNFKA